MTRYAVAVYELPSQPDPPANKNEKPANTSGDPAVQVKEEPIEPVSLLVFEDAPEPSNLNDPSVVETNNGSPNTYFVEVKGEPTDPLTLPPIQAPSKPSCNPINPQTLTTIIASMKDQLKAGSAPVHTLKTTNQPKPVALLQVTPNNSVSMEKQLTASAALPSQVTKIIKYNLCEQRTIAESNNQPKPPRFRPTPENIEQMKRLLAEGLLPSSVSRQMNCDVMTVKRWRKKFKAEWKGVALAEDRRKHNTGRRKILSDELLAQAVKELKDNPRKRTDELPKALGFKASVRTIKTALRERTNWKYSRRMVSDEDLKTAVEMLKEDPTLTASQLPKVMGLKVTGKTMRKALKERTEFKYNRKFRKVED